MNAKEFKQTVSDGSMPSGLSPALQGLWQEARGKWAAAHKTVQDAGDESSAWVHAYLHRKEGDTSNAGYWYSRAGRAMPADPLDKEWEHIVETLLNKQS